MGALYFPLLRSNFQKKIAPEQIYVEADGEKVNLTQMLSRKVNIYQGDVNKNKVLITDGNGNVTVSVGVVMQQAERDQLKKLNPGIAIDLDGNKINVRIDPATLAIDSNNRLTVIDPSTTSHTHKIKDVEQLQSELDNRILIYQPDHPGKMLVVDQNTKNITFADIPDGVDVTQYLTEGLLIAEINDTKIYAPNAGVAISLDANNRINVLYDNRTIVLDQQGRLSAVQFDPSTINSNIENLRNKLTEVEQDTTKKVSKFFESITELQIGEIGEYQGETNETFVRGYFYERGEGNSVPQFEKSISVEVVVQWLMAYMDGQPSYIYNTYATGIVNNIQFSSIRPGYYRSEWYYQYEGDTSRGNISFRIIPIEAGYTTSIRVNNNPFFFDDEQGFIDGYLLEQGYDSYNHTIQFKQEGDNILALLDEWVVVDTANWSYKGQGVVDQVIYEAYLLIDGKLVRCKYFNYSTGCSAIVADANNRVQYIQTGYAGRVPEDLSRWIKMQPYQTFDSYVVTSFINHPAIIRVDTQPAATLDTYSIETVSTTEGFLKTYQLVKTEPNGNKTYLPGKIDITKDLFLNTVERVTVSAQNPVQQGGDYLQHGDYFRFDFNTDNGIRSQYVPIDLLRAEMTAGGHITIDGTEISATGFIPQYADLANALPGEKIVQYVGQPGNGLMTGCFYKRDGNSWKQMDVQPHKTIAHTHLLSEIYDGEDSLATATESDITALAESSASGEPVPPDFNIQLTYATNEDIINIFPDLDNYTDDNDAVVASDSDIDGVFDN